MNLDVSRAALAINRRLGLLPSSSSSSSCTHSSSSLFLPCSWNGSGSGTHSSSSLFLPCSWNGSGSGGLRRQRRLNCSSGDSSPEADGGSSGAGLTYSLLKQQLAVATRLEDYREAARLRDSLRSLEDRQPVLRLRKLLARAVRDQRFQDAAKYRDELKEIAPHALLQCSSDATTLGIRVQVRSVYVQSRSRPIDAQFFYAYRIRISNNSPRSVQLLRRHWIVTDGWGRVEHVWGTGVVGQQPLIPPGAAFEYSSACPLGTPSGRMEGDFEMRPLLPSGSDFDGTNADPVAFLASARMNNNNKEKSVSTFNVAIAPFSLSVLGDDLFSSSSTFLF